MCTGARVSERERERQLLLPAPATSTRCVPVCALLLFYSHHTAPLPHGMTLALFFFAAWPSPEPFPMYVGPCQCLRRSSAPRFSLLYYYYYCFFFFLALSFLLGFLLYPPSPCCSPAWPLLPWRSTAATSPGCTVMGERSRWCVGPEARLPFFVSLFFFFPSATIA